MYIRHNAVLVLFAILCLLIPLCDGFKQGFLPLSSLPHPTDGLTHGYGDIDNHQTMLVRLEAAGALADMKLPERVLRRPRELHPVMMTLSKRNTVTMQRHWKVEQASHTSGESNTDGGDVDRHWDERMQINMSAGDTVPTVSFKAAKENTIELLVVVTRKMHLILKGRLTEYLVATFGSVAQNFKHCSLKASVKISIVDIILLDSNFARREGLEDWSNKNHEEVMGKFCHWVNRIRRPTMNWDSAILLNVGNFKTTALGVAHYQAMCSRESSCLVVVDRGFGTADIIAHEIGHQLGAKHDFEVGSECGLEEQPSRKRAVQKLSRRTPDADDLTIQRDTIMSGILYFELYPFRWSACSRENIQFFLSRPDSACLRTQNSQRTAFTSKQLTQHMGQHKPGLRFTLNEQCALAMRQRGARFCGHSSPVCKQLHCYDVQRGMCLPVEAPWAEGSRCGYKRWCVMGQCLLQGETISPIDGGWSAWEEWGTCSRPCGGGVQFSRRECTSPEPQNGGEHCLGTNVRVRSCNIQNCPDSVDLRQQLCDKVGQKLSKHLQAFKPSIGGANACKLVCLDGTKEVAHNESLPDGTPCYAPGTDICIKGRCWQAGCDKVLGSRMERDNCNVCGGDNSTCYAVSGEFHHSDALAPGAKPVGLTIAVHIPQGVTNAYIKKVSRRSTPYSADAYDDFMILIFEELKTRIRRGETREPFAGAELYYSGSRGKEEIVHIKGQINKNVNILIRVENKNTKLPLPDVEYTYYVSKDASDHLRFDPSGLAVHHYNDPLLRFLRSPRKGAPAEESNEENVEPNPPLETSKPEHSSQTIKEPVGFEWKMDEVPKECTSCSGTVQSHASCYPVFSSQEASKRYGIHPLHPLPPRYCGESLRPSPVTRNCADYCGVRWSWREVNASDYTVTRSTCSVRCGEGLTEVHFTAICEEKIPEKDTLHTIWRESSLGAYACIKAELGEPPEDRVVTNRCTGDCRPLHWVFSDWDKCSERCGAGTKQRSVTCVDDVSNHWPLTECLQHISTVVVGKLNGVDGYVGTELAECFEVDACGGQFMWITTPWSECRSTASYSDMGSLCHSALRRHLDGDSQGLPSSSAFTGFQTRTSRCVLRSASGEDVKHEAPQHYCERAHALKPPEQQACTAELTCHRWTTVHFSQCSTNCGAGQRVGQLSCEQISLSQGARPNVTPVGETDCLYRLGSNISLQIDSRRENPTVYIVESGSSEEREALQRLPYLRPLPFTPGKPLLLACSNPPCHSRSLEWAVSEWSMCSATCGMGYQRRSLRCILVERHTGAPSNSEAVEVEMPGSECTARGLARPAEMRLCEAPPCIKWSPGEWSECKGTCESGTQERYIRCIRQKSLYTTSPKSLTWSSFETPPNVSSTMIEQEVDPAECEYQSKPAEKRSCLLASDCPFWFQGPWSSCSSTCGAGRRFRHVDCRFPNGTVLYVFGRLARDRSILQMSSRRRRNHITESRKHLNTIRCLEPRPVDKTECQLKPCQEDRPFWWPVVSSTCNAKGCIRGYQQRELQCLTPSFQPVDPKECVYSRKPLKMIPCTLQECKTYRWRTDTWTRCPYACGKHSRYRNVRCVDDLGEEYADHLCQAHLRPDSWSICPDACPDLPISCWDQKQRHPASSDGLYELAVHRRVVRIYCSDMESSYPREYLPLHHLNYASIWHFKEAREQNCSSTNVYYKGKVTDTNVTSGTPSEIQSLELLEFPADSVTVFKKLHINLNSLHVDIFDERFSETLGTRFVPYASAKSCSRGTSQLGKFLINLKGTGFTVSKETQWRTSRLQSFGHVARTGDSMIVMGSCGGDCGGCWPDPLLKLEAADASER
ncbi:a disintegrin and metalloproteinase with [Echinococcus multilocularis]|uniref:A disintegrin and metalloproteinase with n=1 Tax=Echinococcus multilocularis TaxID=6211 RepID=A0A068YDU1_ECHMU|nr:a disintegrin and metalloproteinase with [Echinococcus multilocularis]